MLEFIGYTAVFLSTICLLPEIWKALHTHHLQDIAWGMVIFLVAGKSLWVLYAFQIQDYPMLISDGLSLIISIFLIVLKFKYTNFGKSFLKKSKQRA